MGELLARVKTEGNEAEAARLSDQEQDDDHDPAHHAHTFGDGSHASGAAELALHSEGGGLLGLND